MLTKTNMSDGFDSLLNSARHDADVEAGGAFRGLWQTGGCRVHKSYTTITLLDAESSPLKRTVPRSGWC